MVDFFVGVSRYFPAVWDATPPIFVGCERLPQNELFFIKKGVTVSIYRISPTLSLLLAELGRQTHVNFLARLACVKLRVPSAFLSSFGTRICLDEKNFLFPFAETYLLFWTLTSFSSIIIDRGDSLTLFHFVSLLAYRQLKYQLEWWFLGLIIFL